MYTVGAIAGARKWFLLFKMPVAMPEIQKNIGDISIILVRSIAKDLTFKLNPGAINVTKSSVNKIQIMQKNKVRVVKIFIIDEANCQPSSSPSLVSTLLNIGMNAAESVAPDSKLNNRSGILNATQ